jgi:LysM repeat protein
MKKTKLIITNKRRFFAFIFIMMSMCASVTAAAVTRHASVAAAQGEPDIITVCAGDTLWSIASDYSKGSDVRSVVNDIIDANELVSSVIKTGDTLIIPN